MPTDKHHGWKHIEFDGEGKLLIPVGAPCNICDPEPPYASLLRMDRNTGAYEVIAQGIRNTVGFDFEPGTGVLWFSDNGRDMLGDEIPPEELNRLAAPGAHFGYPYVHGGAVLDPEFGKGHRLEDYAAPEARLPAHSARPWASPSTRAAPFPSATGEPYSLPSMAPGIVARRLATKFP